jgi:cytoskeletal protein RodZ
MPMPEETFGARLRRERERRHIALSSISENTKISASLFEGLERNDVSRWPSGIFRRAFIRSYAAAIGLDADAIAKEFVERFPDPAEPAHADAVDAPAAKTAPHAAGRPDDRRASRALITVTVRVPRWITERLFTVGRPWSRA